MLTEAYPRARGKNRTYAGSFPLRPFAALRSRRDRRPSRDSGVAQEGLAPRPRRGSQCLRVARVYRKSLDVLPQVAVPDWQLIERLAETFAPYGEVHLEASDTRGTHSERDVAVFRKQVEEQDEPVDTIALTVWRGFQGEADSVWARATTSSVWRGGMFAAQSDDEAIVNHLTARAEELFDAARERFTATASALAIEETSTEETSTGSRVRTFLYDPWTIRIGGGVVLAALGVIGAWLFGWIF